jgi:hypothetical protein
VRPSYPIPLAIGAGCFVFICPQLKIQRYLVCASRTDIVGSDGFAPLHSAAKQNSVGIPTLLEEYGAEIVSGVRGLRLCPQLPAGKGTPIICCTHAFVRMFAHGRTLATTTT